MENEKVIHNKFYRFLYYEGSIASQSLYDYIQENKAFKVSVLIQRFRTHRFYFKNDGLNGIKMTEIRK